MLKKTLASLMTAAALGLTATAHAITPPALTAAEEAKAKQLYFDKCSHCHGVDGAGDGYATKVTRPVPRDFISCQFKFRRTRPTEDTLPTVRDIYLSITNGMPGTSMPAWGGDGVFIKTPMISEDDRWLLAKYVARFCDFMTDPDEPEPQEADWPMVPPATEAMLEEGKAVFEENCATCHGSALRGNGPQAPIQTFDISPVVQEFIGAEQANVPIWPRNLRKPWTFRNGDTPEDIFRTISTGLLGTPMASFAGQLTEEQRFALVNYIKSNQYPDYIRNFSLRKDSVVAELVEGEIPLDVSSSVWQNAEASAFPLIGQIIAPPRQFWPANDLVMVKAVYNDSHLGLYVSWDDRTGPVFDDTLPAMKEEDIGKLVVVPNSGAVAVGQTYIFKAFRYQGEGKFDSENVTWSADSGTIGEDGSYTANEPGNVNVKAEAGGESAAAAVLALREDVLQVQVPTKYYEGVEKPHFLNGDSSHPVHLWTLSSQAPGKLSIVKSAGHFEKDQKKIPGAAKDYKIRSTYKDGQWHVVIVRPFEVAPVDDEKQIAFLTGKDAKFVPMAFNTTDGNNGEQGMQKAISAWYAVLLKPPPDNTPKVAGLTGATITFVLLILCTIIVNRYKRAEETRLAAAAKGEE